MLKERTLVIIKPDGVSRSLVGEILTRFEKTGLKIVALKMVWVNEDFAKRHYFLDEIWAKNVFEKTKATKEKEGQPFPHKDHLEYGKMIQSWNASFLREGPVVALVLEGPHVIEIVRKMIGSTEPKQSSPGTIRGDYAMTESYTLANEKGRVLRNLIHASDSLETAEREIKLWFSPEELHSYKKELDKHIE